MSENDIYLDLVKMLTSKYDVEESKIFLEVELMSILDSIDFLNFILDVKRHYKVNVNEDVILQIRTLKNVIDIVIASLGK